MGTEDMAEGSGSQKVNPNLVAEIVSSYVAKRWLNRSGSGASRVRSSHHLPPVAGLVRASQSLSSGLWGFPTPGSRRLTDRGRQLSALPTYVHLCVIMSFIGYT